MMYWGKSKMELTQQHLNGSKHPLTQAGLWAIRKKISMDFEDITKSLWAKQKETVL